MSWMERSSRKPTAEFPSCFGFPQAHEDAAQRAIRFGLKVVEEVQLLGERLPHIHDGISLSAGVVAHTETAVVESKAALDESGFSSSVSIGGKVRTVVNRLEALAEMGETLITESTYQITRNNFDCESLGEQRVRGIGERIELFKIEEERSRFNEEDWEQADSVSPLVGRDRELGLLLDRWEQAAEGMGPGRSSDRRSWTREISPPVELEAEDPLRRISRRGSESH